MAILASAPDTLISVAGLYRQGLEVVFKIPGGPGIYLQGKLLYQGTVDTHNDMFYVNTRDLLNLSITIQNPDRFTGYSKHYHSSQFEVATRAPMLRRQEKRGACVRTLPSPPTRSDKQVLWLATQAPRPSQYRRRGHGK